MSYSVFSGVALGGALCLGSLNGVCGGEAGAAALALSLEVASQVQRYERVDFAIRGVGAYGNPYDPAVIRVDLALSDPAGQTLHLPAFYYQAFEYRTLPQGNRRREWIHPTNPPQWRARFAAQTPGTYTAVAVATDGRGMRRSNAVRFTCFTGTPSTEKGYVRVSTRDARFFECSDGSPFFVLGQNVAFVGADQYLHTERAGEVFRTMAAQGANAARVWVCAEDWALGIEARKSAWGRSWGWQPPFAPLPGRDGYHAGGLCIRLGGSDAVHVTLAPTWPVAVRPGATYQLSGRVHADPEAALRIELEGLSNNEPARGAPRGSWVPFARTLVAASNQWWLGRLTLRAEGAGGVLVRDLSLREAGTGPELLWEAEPRLAARGFYNPVDSYLLDRLLEAAEREGVHLQLCLLTRDHYMHDLRDPGSPAYQSAIDDARKLLRYAVARWGYSPRVLAWEYFNEMDPGAPTERFHRELGEYLEQADPYRHLRTTSGWGPAPKHWTHPNLDIADLHHYLRPNAPPPWTNEVAVVLERAALLRKHAPDKPAILGEFGLADERWGRSPHMKADTNGVHFHNALWASAFSGLSGTAMFWWWETLDQMDLYAHYRPLADFIRDIPFTTVRLQPVVLASQPSGCQVLAWRNARQMAAWVFNPEAAWWQEVIAKRLPTRRDAETIRITGLNERDYRIEWWDSWTGRRVRELTARTTRGELTLSVPAFDRDIAFKLQPVR
ncbi:MAG: DUF5060 domain-containing protein [Verrucomicrobia bacterium]|nr:DUF5060 domain-containing protein [Verrucomicrobiota bacterium]